MSEEAVCCPKFEPAGWHDKTITWKDKRFVKTSVFTIFYMPLNYGGAMAKVQSKIAAAGAEIQEYLMISDSVSPWKMDLYVAVDKEIPGVENVLLSGTYLSRVYEGPFQDTGKWMEDMSKTVAERNLTMKRPLMWYTTCPSCAKKYGKNYVVIFAEL